MSLFLQVLIFRCPNWTWFFCIGYEVFRKILGAKTYYNWLVWNIGKKFARPLTKIWIDKINPCLCQTWGIKFKYHDKYFKINGQLWKFGCGKSFQGTCFGHVISKVCQYAIVDEKVHMGLKYVSIKFA